MQLAWLDGYSVYAGSYIDSTGGIRQAEISSLMPERFQMFDETDLNSNCCQGKSKRA